MSKRVELIGIAIFALVLIFSGSRFAIAGIIPEESCESLYQKYSTQISQYDSNQDGKISSQEVIAILNDWLSYKISSEVFVGLLSYCRQNCSLGVPTMPTPIGNQPVSGTLSASATTVSVGENITLTVIGRDGDGVGRVAVWYHGEWHLKDCPKTPECSASFTFSETSPGTYRYYGYVYGSHPQLKWEGTWTTPGSPGNPLKVEVKTTTPTPTCTDECSSLGVKQCCNNDTGSQTCGNYDDDSCLEWSSCFSCGADGCVGAIWRDYYCSGKNCTYYDYPNDPRCVTAGCTGNVSLELKPSTLSPSSGGIAFISGLSNCDGKGTYVRRESCEHREYTYQYCNCSISGSGCSCDFIAPSSPGTHIFYACVDKNDDGDFQDSGERAVATLEVSGTPSAENDPVSGTLSALPETVKVNEEISLTVLGRDKNGVEKIRAYYQGSWHTFKCGRETECSYTWKFRESQVGEYRYWADVYGLKPDGSLERAYPTPESVTVKVTAEPGIGPIPGVGIQLPQCSFSDKKGVWAKNIECSWSTKCNVGETCKKTCVTFGFVDNYVTTGTGATGERTITAFTPIIGVLAFSRTADLCVVDAQYLEALPSCPFSGKRGEVWVKPDVPLVCNWQAHKCKVGTNCTKECVNVTTAPIVIPLPWTLPIIGNQLVIPVGASIEVKTFANRPGGIYAGVDIAGVGVVVVGRNICVVR